LDECDKINRRVKRQGFLLESSKRKI